MKQFKKRTIALVLASVVTVVGAFGAENYKNSLMSLKFESKGSGAVSMTLLTKRDYANTITPVKKDATTYVIMLPETNSQMSYDPELAGDIESVNVRTMPYTTNSKGYTKITIKTVPNTQVTAQKAIYISEKEPETPLLPPPAVEPTQPVAQPPVTPPQNNPAQANQPVDIKQSVKQFEPPSEQSLQNNSEEVAGQSQTPTPPKESSSYELILILMGIIVAISVSAFLILKARDKMAEITGEQSSFDLDEEKEAKPESKRQKIKHTIKKLDRMYAKPVKLPVNIQEEVVQKAKPKPIEDVVDLDELFQEKTKQPEIVENVESEEENKALEDFLNGFSFDEVAEPPKEEPFDEDFYQKCIADKDLKFTEDDVVRINSLLNSEISDEAISNLSKIAVTNPIKKKSHTELLENFVTTYTVNQNITFTKDDIDALNKLMNVELDSDFITDLRCNPERLGEMQQEIEKHKTKPHKASEVLTLSVKNMLPDLSEALKKQGGRRVESNAQPQVVYYSEGYDVSTLKLDEAMPDLAKEVDNDEAYKSRPSDEIELAQSGYDVARMNVSDALPDLDDALKNPDKYNQIQTPEIEVNEDDLLKSLDNVEFKPFEEGYEAPSVSDVQEEFNQLGGGLEIVNSDEEPAASPVEDEKDDFEALYDDNYVDLDTPEKEPKAEVKVQKTPKEEIKVHQKTTQDKEDEAKRLIQLIEEKREERKIQREIMKQKKVVVKRPVAAKVQINCIYEGKNYSVISSANFNENMGCYLIKNGDEYKVLGFTKDRTFEIKHYDKLKNEKLEARISDKLDDGSIRYIVRIASHKFIMRVEGDKMEYIMDLC